MNNEKSISIWTDGACSGNPGPGGWGALIKYPYLTKKLSGSEAHTTNNRMEILAIINALKSINLNLKITIYLRM